jgi:hypothetical protein
MLTKIKSSKGKINTGFNMYCYALAKFSGGKNAPAANYIGINNNLLSRKLFSQKRGGSL